MKIIALGHRRYVGKDTAIRFMLCHAKLHYKLHSAKTAFASRLKAICWDLYWKKGLNNESYYETRPEKKDEILPELGLTPRQVWINVGNYHRNIYNDVWIDSSFTDLQFDLVFVTDLRYPNEAHAIKERGGTLIRIDRDVKKHADVADSALDSYQGWDYVLTNNGTLDDLHKKVVTVTDEVLST